MKLRTKTLITIGLAIVYVWLAGYFERHAYAKQVLSTAEVRAMYADHNRNYFNDKLPKDVKISFTLEDPHYMALTTKHLDGTFDIALNPGYTKADRVTEYVLLHEECHIQTWDQDAKLVGVNEHGPVWRTCMLGLDANGIFRKLFIDNYGGN